MNERLPQWVRAESGNLINVSRADAIIRVEDGDSHRRFWLSASFGEAVYPLAEFTDSEDCDKAFDALEKMLPFAVIDMGADIIFPNRESKTP